MGWTCWLLRLARPERVTAWLAWLGLPRQMRATKFVIWQRVLGQVCVCVRGCTTNLNLINFLKLTNYGRRRETQRKAINNALNLCRTGQTANLWLVRHRKYTQTHEARTTTVIIIL